MPSVLVDPHLAVTRVRRALGLLARGSGRCADHASRRTQSTLVSFSDMLAAAQPALARSGPASPARAKQVDIIPCTTMFGKPSFFACSRVGVIVLARAREHPAAALVDHLRRSARGRRRSRSGTARGARLSSLRGPLVDDEARRSRRVRLRRQEATGACGRARAARPSSRRADVGLVHDVVAAALLVALDDRRARAHARADRDRREQLPVLARVQVPEQVLQVPLADELVALGVVEQRRRDTRA